MVTLQLYKMSVCLLPSSMMSTSCQVTHVLKRAIVTYSHMMRSHEVKSYRGATEDFPIQFPLAVDVVLGDLHLKTSRLAIKKLHSVNGPDHFHIECFEGETHQTSAWTCFSSSFGGFWNSLGSNLGRQGQRMFCRFHSHMCTFLCCSALISSGPETCGSPRTSAPPSWMR